jgi:hypothetical protein
MTTQLITPQVGKTYVVNHSSGLIDATFIRELVYNPSFNSNRFRQLRSTTHYLFQNLKTGRDIVIKSRVKIRRQLGTEPYERFFA